MRNNQNIGILRKQKHEIDELIGESESIQELKNDEFAASKALLHETDELQKLINVVKKKTEQKKLSHFMDIQDLNK